MLSESEELIDAAYSATYRAATFQGNFNPETGKAYADEAVQLFGKGTVSENEGGNKSSSNVIKRSGPVVKTKANTISNLGRTTKKKKKSRDNGSISKANSKRGISAKQEYMMDISNAGEVAGKRVGTVDNDLDYHQLDGTFPHLLGVVEPFDQTTLTHQELLMVGIQRGVPSHPKHRKTYIQGLVDVDDIKEVGPNFKKEVDLHSAVAVDTRQAIQAKFPEWIELRENYFRQLEMKAEKVVQAVVQARREGNGAPPVISDATRQQFLLLLLAVRKVSIRIVGEYELQCLQVQRDPQNHNARDAANHLVKYVFSFPRCLEPFNAPPFTDWTGVDLTMNPLATERDISGRSTVLGSGSGSDSYGVGRLSVRTGIEGVLAVQEADRKHCNYVNDMLAHIYKQRAALGDNFTSYHGSDVNLSELRGSAAALNKGQAGSNNQRGEGEGEGHGHGHGHGEVQDRDRPKQVGGVDLLHAKEDHTAHNQATADVGDDSTAFLSSHGGYDSDEDLQTNIDTLIRQTSSSVNKALRLDRDKKLFLLGKTKMKWWWRAWRRVYANELRVADALIVQSSRNLRQCFDSLSRNQWVCVKFRGLQQRAHKRLVHQTLDGWKAYSAWTKRFNDIFNRSVRHTKRKILYAMHEFAETVFENRQFRYHSEQRHYVAVFRALQHNVVLSQYELKKRLQHQHSSGSLHGSAPTATVFLERATLRGLFNRWRRRNQVLHSLDDLEELVELTHMKDALVRWYILTYGPRSQRTARKIARARGYVKDLRQSVESGMRVSYDKMRAGVSSGVKSARRAIRGPPPPSPEEVEALRASGELKRKSRMVNALRYAQAREREREREEK